ncbi:IclR family transcriptional regulator [Conexibacter woesei]|uniref:Transcriptional regulator, IclR family n=1 Tax=Conexibacter woesei (strain DSM 14684 / CCUG 47730 / CIP 108061 / JCM 11494 / NBRC 100937 / ID131577) TaxID=469383 RepID=D3FBA7_CONWI|nr:IclR family transcriptional regulator [Conexibacter woesei]ADB53299.1 transcriptional regulator, IclR family [Conexibacter woesei DSM 14684]
MSAAGGAVKSADRVLAILDLLAEREALTFSEVVAALELPKSSVHNLLQTMIDRDYVEYDAAAKSYGLGIRVWQIGRARRDVEHLRTVLKPLMDELRSRTEETVQLARLEGADAVYLEISESPHPMKLSSTPGVRLPAHASGIGKVLLAALDPDDARARLEGSVLESFTSHTLTDVEAIMAELDRVRQQGYGTDNEEFAIGCRCTAMAVRDGAGQVVGAISVSIPTPRYSRDVAARVRKALGEMTTAAQAQLARRG